MSDCNFPVPQVDIEGEELASLPQWLETGVLDRVQQLGLEFHLPTLHNQVHYTSTPLHFTLKFIESSLLTLTYSYNMKEKTQNETKHSNCLNSTIYE